MGKSLNQVARGAASNGHNLKNAACTPAASSTAGTSIGMKPMSADLITARRLRGSGEREAGNPTLALVVAKVGLRLRLTDMGAKPTPNDETL